MDVEGLFALGDLPQVLDDARQVLRPQRGRRYQRDVRRYVTGVRVAQALAPGLQLGVIRLGQSDGDAAVAPGPAAGLLAGCPAGDSPRVDGSAGGRKPIRSYTSRSVRPATSRAVSAPRARISSSPAGSASSSFVRARTGSAKATTTSARSFLRSP